VKFRFLPPAKDELEAAIAYYEQQRRGLGENFRAEVQRTVASILLYPTAAASITKEVRRGRTRRFPYGVLYSIESDHILIIAVMHLHRRPSYWKKRL